MHASVMDNTRPLQERSVGAHCACSGCGERDTPGVQAPLPVRRLERRPSRDGVPRTWGSYSQLFVWGQVRINKSKFHQPLHPPDPHTFLLA